jgi:hypothetical protein
VVGGWSVSVFGNESEVDIGGVGRGDGRSVEAEEEV